MITENKFNLRENTDFPQKIAVKSADIETIVGDLMQKLGAKQKLVLSSRFGVSGQEPLTLGSDRKNFEYHPRKSAPDRSRRAECAQKKREIPRNG